VTIYTKTARNYHRNGFQLLKETRLGIRALCGSYMLRFTTWCIKKDHGWTVIAKIKKWVQFFFCFTVYYHSTAAERRCQHARCCLWSSMLKFLRRISAGSDRTTDKNRVVSAAARLNI